MSRTFTAAGPKAAGLADGVTLHRPTLWSIGANAVRVAMQSPVYLFGAACVSVSAVEHGIEEGQKSDGDGVPDLCDNCPDYRNASQVDTDGDYQGDSCDPCPLDPVNDVDQDGKCAQDDLCPLDPLNDEDGDGLWAEEDNCPTDRNPNCFQSAEVGQFRGLI